MAFAASCEIPVATFSESEKFIWLLSELPDWLTRISNQTGAINFSSRLPDKRPLEEAGR
jgi:hypothetical protein